MGSTGGSWTPACRVTTPTERSLGTSALASTSRKSGRRGTRYDGRTKTSSSVFASGQILSQLRAHARKDAFPEGRAGVVRVELRQTASNRFVLLVSDDGVGLPPSLDIRQTESLGLQLVCTLADQLRGELRIERGAGTAFRLEFDGDA